MTVISFGAKINLIYKKIMGFGVDNDNTSVLSIAIRPKNHALVCLFEGYDYTKREYCYNVLDGKVGLDKKGITKNRLFYV